MASAGGHWMKASVGPFAGQMVFVPKTGMGMAKEIGAGAGGSYDITKSATVQGGLAVYQNEHGQWVVAHASSGVSLGPTFTSEAGALVAMEELNQMGGKIWVQKGSEIANIPGLKDTVKPIMGKHNAKTGEQNAKALEELQNNYSVNQKKAAATATATQAKGKYDVEFNPDTGELVAGTAAKPAAATNKANPANYTEGAAGGINGVGIESPGGAVKGKIAYNQETGKFDVIDSDNNVVSSHTKFSDAKDYGPIDLEVTGGQLANLDKPAATATANQAGQATGYQKGTLTQPVPQGASQAFKDAAEDVNVTYKMGKQTTKAGVPIDIGHPDGKPSITYNEKTGKYHANDITGKTVSTHDTMGEAGAAIGKMYAPKTPTGTYANSLKTTFDVNGQQMEAVKVNGGHVTFDKWTGNYTLHTSEGVEVPGFDSLESAQNTAIALKGTGGKAGMKWGAELYGSYYKADEVLAQASGQHAKAMTQAEHAGMAAWQGNQYYTPMNDHLWKGTPASPTVLKHIANVKSGMAKGKGLPQDMVLERKKHAGSSLAKIIDNIEVGGIYHSKGMDATSIKKNTWSGTYAVKYNAPKGLKGFYMNSKGYSSKYSNEFEFLIAPNTAWKVISKYANDYGGTTIEVVFVGQE